ncbi:hypothetical protein P0W64_16595 [Tsukamurella sp. 8F]|uniref:hypothetical protein n=1 Tax=unclassified Tsukamurella TaxID=2633480 RepID=UPI0023B9F811|nr:MULTISPECIES: hypothetical protein [unclassified Tsukamurella]MDF0531155.1 hypothetical protein [Tsukamurella sp. 8J]MDF0588401.1 hypothetical protein [Tsukamurella sp. 8F]
MANGSSIDTEHVQQWVGHQEKNAEAVRASAQWDTTGVSASLGDAYHGVSTALTALAARRQPAVHSLAQRSDYLASRGRADIAGFERTDDEALNIYNQSVENI